jgi:uncharacterized protein (TIGR02996 family)
VTTEDDFQAALDANPEDWQTRLVFADWLQERGDARAEGYRAMGALGLFPRLAPTHPTRFGFTHPGNDRAPELKMEYAVLPHDWYDAARAAHPEPPRHHNPWWVNLPTRREAENAAALAFAKLPADRRAELLAAVA